MKPKKERDVLSESYVKRLIGPIPQSEERQKVLSVLRGEVIDDKTRVLRKLAVEWCETHTIQRKYRRLQKG